MPHQSVANQRSKHYERVLDSQPASAETSYVDFSAESDGFKLRVHHLFYLLLVLALVLAIYKSRKY